MNTTETKTREAGKVKLTLQDIINQNPNGEIEVGKIETQLGLTRHETLEAIRDNNGCALKVGRKGGKTVCLTGDKAKAFLEARSKYLGNSPKKYRSSRIQSETPKQGFQLRIEIGGKSLFLPVTSELVAA